MLYILWDDWLIFMISGSNEQLQQQLEYTLLKPDCHSWWISKMQFGREDILEEWYSIKFCFKLGKMPEKRMECFRLLFDHLACIKHQFLRGIRDSRKAGSLWGMMRGVGGVRKSILQSWMANWGDERGCDKIHWHAQTKGLPWGLPEVVGMVQQVHCSRRWLLQRGLEFHVCTINKSAHTKNVWKLI